MKIRDTRKCKFHPKNICWMSMTKHLKQGETVKDRKLTT